MRARVKICCIRSREEAARRGSDALLLDSGRPAGDPPRLGGTGLTHDWRVARRIRERVALPLFLAGGLGAQNVAAAIAAVRPFAVDVCTGLRRGRRAGQAPSLRLSGSGRRRRVGLTGSTRGSIEP